MKKFIAMLALVLSTLAAAESTMIFEVNDGRYYDVAPEFEVNKDLSRAWVNVVLSEKTSDDMFYTDNRVKIEGLSYDVATKNIVLEKNGEEIICGSLYDRRWVIDGGRSIRKTGRCTFSVKNVKKAVDNGFEIYYVRMIQVFLNVE